MSPALRRMLLYGVDAIAAVSVGLGLAWWGIGLRRGILQAMPGEALPFLFGFLAVQILAACTVAHVLWTAHRSLSSLLIGFGVFLAVLLLMGNAIFYFTPALGVPFLVLAVLTSAVGALLRRRKELDPSREA